MFWRAAAVIACLVGAASLWAVHEKVYRDSLTGLRREGLISAELDRSVLQSELEKQRSIPVILADDSEVTTALTAPSEPVAHAISTKLE
ncbi:MAG: sensor histidine kinase, partial [Caulobacteraceae bacterium]|nr:sensor histidine kinase [Caulobacteraceae bacterium]